MKKIKSTKRTAEEVGIALKYANSIIATLREPFLVLNKNLQVVSANRSFYTTFKVAEKETVGQLLPDLGNRQWNISKLIHLLKEILPEKTVLTNYEIEHEFKTIGHRIMNLNALQLRIPKMIARLITGGGGGGGGGELILLAIEDITEHKLLQKQLSEFISLTSHQLKNPPTAIKLLTERIIKGRVGTFTEKQREYLDDIRSTNQRMINLINALLNVSRIELGGFTIQVSKEDVCAIVQSILDELKSAINKKRLKLKTIFPEKNVLLMLDEPLFHIVIGNLVMNAINYTAEGTIQVECKEVNKGQTMGGKALKENSFVVVVSDTGYGIPKHQQGKLFTKFFRADNIRDKHTDGTGLGLYITKSILDNSGGSIWFTSEEGKGTAFYVAIPLTGMKSRVGIKKLVGG